MDVVLDATAAGKAALQRLLTHYKDGWTIPEIEQLMGKVSVKLTYQQVIDATGIWVPLHRDRGPGTKVETRWVEVSRMNDGPYLFNFPRPGEAEYHRVHIEAVVDYSLRCWQAIGEWKPA